MPRKHKAALDLPPMPPLRDGIHLPAGVYTRRSDDDQSSFSPEAQEKIGRMYCQQNRLAVSAVYFDDDYSGTNGERPDFETATHRERNDESTDHEKEHDTENTGRRIHERFCPRVRESLEQMLDHDGARAD